MGWRTCLIAQNKDTYNLKKVMKQGQQSGNFFDNDPETKNSIFCGTLFLSIAEQIFRHYAFVHSYR